MTSVTVKAQRGNGGLPNCIWRHYGGGSSSEYCHNVRYGKN